MVKRRGDLNLFEMLKDPAPAEDSELRGSPPGEPPSGIVERSGEVQESGPPGGVVPEPVTEVRYRTIEEIQADAEHRRDRVRGPLFRRRRGARRESASEESLPGWAAPQAPSEFSPARAPAGALVSGALVSGAMVSGKPVSGTAASAGVAVSREGGATGVDIQEESTTDVEAVPIPAWAGWLNSTRSYRRVTLIVAGVVTITLAMLGFDVGRRSAGDAISGAGDRSFKESMVRGTETDYEPQWPKSARTLKSTVRDVKPTLAPAAPGTGETDPGEKGGAAPPPAVGAGDYIVAVSRPPRNNAVEAEKVLKYLRQQLVDLPSKVENAGSKLIIFVGPFATQEEARRAQDRVRKLRKFKGVPFDKCLLQRYGQ